MITVDTKPDNHQHPGRPKRRRLRRWLQWGHLAVLPLLLLLFMLYVVQRQQQPFYGWLAGTAVERACLRILPLVWRQKSFLQQQALNAALTPEERARATVILRRMDAIRPSHAVRLKNGEKLFGRLRRIDGGDDRYVLKQWDGQRWRERPIRGDEMVIRQVIVYPDEELSPRDLRFLLTAPDCNHYYLHPHLIITAGDFAKAFEIHQLLTSLQSDFEAAFGPLIQERSAAKSHIRHFTSRVDLAAAAAEFGEFDLINSSSFFVKSDNCLFLCEPGSRPEQGLHLLLRDDPAADGGAWRRLVRHEGAHQLVGMHGIYRQFETVPFWIEEGLAQYCERSPLDSPHPEKLQLLRLSAAHGGLIPWSELIRLSRQQLESMSQEHVDLAYAQAWLLFRFCMQNDRRARFLQFLLQERDHDRGGEERFRQIRLMNALRLTESGLKQALTIEMRQSPPPRNGAAGLN